MADKTMVDYTRKIKPYFEGVAPIEPTTTAASAHAIGDIFYLDGTLVVATAAISIGDTITVGTNVVAADDVVTQIKNKTITTDAVPTSGSTNAVQSGGVYTALTGKANTSDLATVATSGSYNDLSNKPTIPAAQVNSDWNAASGLAQILNKPSVTSSVTSGSAALVTSGAVYTEVNNKHKVTKKTVDTTSWTADTTSQSGSTLYKKAISLSHVYVPSPSVDIGTSSGTGLPTSAQQTAYNLLQYVTVDGTTMYLYASAIPTTAFYINVEGVD